MTWNANPVNARDNIGDGDGDGDGRGGIRELGIDWDGLAVVLWP